MCRSIQPLFNREPAPSDADVHAAALQFVRKISGTRAPSKANEAVFAAAVDEIASASARLLATLETKAPARPRSTPKRRERAAAVRP